MAEVLTARIGDDLNRGLDIVAKTEQLDKSTVLRKLLSRSLAEWKKERAIRSYCEGKLSTEQAARFAGLSVWSFFDALKQKKIPVSYDVEELERDIKNVRWKQ